MMAFIVFMISIFWKVLGIYDNALGGGGEKIQWSI